MRVGQPEHSHLPCIAQQRRKTATSRSDLCPLFAQLGMLPTKGTCPQATTLRRASFPTSAARLPVPALHHPCPAGLSGRHCAACLQKSRCQTHPAATSRHHRRRRQDWTERRSRSLTCPFAMSCHHRRQRQGQRAGHGPGPRPSRNVSPSPSTAARPRPGGAARRPRRWTGPVAVSPLAPLPEHFFGIAARKGGLTTPVQGRSPSSAGDSCTGERTEASHNHIRVRVTSAHMLVQDPLLRFQVRVATYRAFGL